AGAGARGGRSGGAAPRVRGLRFWCQRPRRWRRRPARDSARAAGGPLMRFAIIGTGSIGQRHLKNLRALGHETVVFDTDRRRAEDAAATVGADTLPSLEAGADAKLDGGLVCTPPVSHLPLARMVLPWGSHLFIEKPVAAESAGVADVLTAAAAQRTLVLVGANLRFFRPLQRVKALVDEGRIGRVLSVRAQCGFYLPSWKPDADYR